MVQRALPPSALVPPGLVVESAICDGTATVITVRPTGDTSLCPGCKSTSGGIHSRYQRCLSDLPLAARPVRLMGVARRFRCHATLRARRIFTERFDDGALAPWARRTTRLDRIVHHLGLALGGRPAASFTRRLMLPVSNDTLLRVVRRRRCPPFAPPSVIGIDRLGLAAQSEVRNDHLRPRAATTDHSLTRQRASHCAGLARGPATDRCGRARPRRWLRPCCGQGTPARHPGRRPLAPHGERQPRLPGCGSQIHAPGPHRGRLRHHLPVLGDGCTGQRRPTRLARWIAKSGATEIRIGIEATHGGVVEAGHLAVVAVELAADTEGAPEPAAHCLVNAARPVRPRNALFPLAARARSVARLCLRAARQTHGLSGRPHVLLA
ncbi:hypothetical protein ACVWXM_002488 [Bradyrhizobium sp. GM7.3]